MLLCIADGVRLLIWWKKLCTLHSILQEFFQSFYHVLLGISFRSRLSTIFPTPLFPIVLLLICQWFSPCLHFLPQYLITVFEAFQLDHYLQFMHVSYFVGILSHVWLHAVLRWCGINDLLFWCHTAHILFHFLYPCTIHSLLSPCAGSGL